MGIDYFCKRVLGAGGTNKKKSKKYMNKNIGCNILIVG
jgi:hypothetical protein